MKSILQSNRANINKELSSIESRRFFSPALYGLSKAIHSAVSRHVQGKLLDVGCGDMPYRNILRSKAAQYDTLDVEQRASGVKYVGSVQKMDMVGDAVYDSLVCFEVLEHVPDPFQAVREMARVLKQNGTLILSVPHLSRLHEEPNDYYRYTKHGLKAMLEHNGFKILEMKATGSIFSFLGHQWSSFFVCLFWGVPLLKHIIFFLNKWFCVLPLHYIDYFFLKNSVLPLGYVCVAQKQ